MQKKFSERISGEIPKVIAGGNPEEMSRTITIEILATSGVMPGRIPKRVLGESLERILEKNPRRIAKQFHRVITEGIC